MILVSLRDLLDRHFRPLRKSVHRNLARLTPAFLVPAHNVRFGCGSLRSNWVLRALPEGNALKRNY